MSSSVQNLVVVVVCLWLGPVACGEDVLYGVGAGEGTSGQRCVGDADCAAGLVCVAFTPGYSSCQCVDGTCADGAGEGSRYSAPLSRAVDVLFVVDDSGSMCEEQQGLRDALPSFLDHLEATGLDYNVAVVTTDVEDPARSGRFNNRADTEPGASCAAEVEVSCDNHSPRVIRRSDPRYVLPDGSADLRRLEQDLACNLTVGTRGSGFEAGLEAARLALSPELVQGHNAGFSRDDALLAIMFVSDENDCSDRGVLDKVNGNICEWQSGRLVAVDEYVEFFSNLKRHPDGRPAPNRVVMGGIIGPDLGLRVAPGSDVEPSCSTATGQAYSGYRYEEVIGAFTLPGYTVASICEPPYEWVLASFAELLVTEVVALTPR